jgi:hypothetical protein
MIHASSVDPFEEPLCGSFDTFVGKFFRWPRARLTVVDPRVGDLRALIDCKECLNILSGKNRHHNKRFTRGNQRVIIKK